MYHIKWLILLYFDMRFFLDIIYLKNFIKKIVYFQRKNLILIRLLFPIFEVASPLCKNIAVGWVRWSSNMMNIYFQGQSLSTFRGRFFFVLAYCSILETIDGFDAVSPSNIEVANIDEACQSFLKEIEDCWWKTWKTMTQWVIFKGIMHLWIL